MGDGAAVAWRRIRHGNRLAQVLELFDNAQSQRAQINRLAVTLIAANAGKRENIVKRCGDVLDALGHLLALGFIGHALDPNPQGCKRRFEVMPDGSEHDVLFVQQPCNPRFHGVMRCDQAPCITGPLFIQLHRLFRPAREISDSLGQLGKRLRDTSQDQKQRRDQDDERDEGLGEQQSQGCGGSPRKRDPSRFPHPPLFPLDRGDQQAARLPVFAISKTFSHAPSADQPLIFAGSESDDHDAFRIDPLIQEEFSQIVFPLAFLRCSCGGNREGIGNRVAQCPGQATRYPWTCITVLTRCIGRSYSPLISAHKLKGGCGQNKILAPFFIGPEDQNSRDDLRDHQCQSHGNHDLAKQAGRQKTPHSELSGKGARRFTGAAKRYPPPRTVRISCGSRVSASILRRRRLT